MKRVTVMTVIMVKLLLAVGTVCNGLVPQDHMISVHVVVHSVVQYVQGSSNMSNNRLIARDSMSGFVLVITPYECGECCMAF